MSALLRALMAQQVTPSKPNLAIITDSMVSAEALNTNKYIHAGVTAKIEKGKAYRVEFDMVMTFTESSGVGRVQLGNYAPWGNNGRFFNELVNDTPTITRHIDDTVTTNYSPRPNDTGLIVWKVENKVGTLRISNLVITEV